VIKAFDPRTTPLDPGTVLLEASAGTGKTYALVAVLLRLLIERRIERLEQAAVVTFTVAAADELKNRLHAALHKTLTAVRGPCDDAFFAELARRDGAEPILRGAIADFDRVGVTTIHGFCKRLLEDAAFECHEPFAVEFTPDPLPLLHRAAADALRSHYETEPGPLGALVRTSKLTPKLLVNLYRLWRRHPRVALAPAEPDVARCVTDLADALRRAGERLDANALAAVGSIAWKGPGSPWRHGDPTAEELAAFAVRARNEPALVLDQLEAMAPRHYAERVKVRSTPRSHFDRPFFAACDDVAAAAADGREHLRSDLLAAMHARLEAGKQRDQVWTFDDLIVRTHQALMDPDRHKIVLAAVREQFTVGLIDEFQDTDALQYEIFAECFAKRLLLLVGDPKQAIYGFRGADVRAYLAASQHARERTWTLARNHRSAAPLVGAVGAVFAVNDRPFVDAAIVARPVLPARDPGELTIQGDGEAVLHFRVFAAADPPTAIPDATAAILHDVVAEIARLLRSGARLDDRPLQPRDIAVLTRKNVQATELQDALRAAGIPSAIGKAGDIFTTDELQELLRFLVAVLQPTNRGAVRAAMSTRLWGLDAAALVAIDADDDAADRAFELLAGWRWSWLRHGVVVMLDQALADLDVHARWLAWHGGERRLTNLRQIVELLHAAEHAHRLSPEGLLAWLQHERQAQDELDYTLRELRLESDDDAVQILTAHGSKGLQYEIVFCPFQWSDAKPRSPDVVAVAGGHELVPRLVTDHPLHARATEERLAEEVRLTYVALTRARRRCYVHVPTAKLAKGSALLHLLQGANEPVDVLTRLAATSNGAIEVGTIATATTIARLPSPAGRALRPARVPTRLLTARGLHSYSSMISKGQGHEPTLVADDAPSAITTPAAPTATRRGIFAFARGPGPGQCLHTLLERVDLRHVDRDATRDVVQQVLAAAGLLGADAHDGPLDPVADVHRMLQQLAAARIPGGPTLADLCAGPRQAEWPFTLPAAAGNVRALAGIFAHGSSAPARAEAERLHLLPPRALHGFLVGFVDLVAEHDGRCWILDWKSNHLGDDGADYARDRLLPAMVAHDYVLQYHLYVLALHRHLRQRLGRGYDYERHVGGVVYPFLRGVEAGSDRGLFVDRVPADLIAALDDWLTGSRRELR